MPKDIETFTEVLVKWLKPSQVSGILEAISEGVSEWGQCPLCGCEDIPVDDEGNEIEGDDISDASEFREVHDDDCPVQLIEKAMRGRWETVEAKS